MVTDLLGQIFAGGNAQFGREHLDQHRHQVGPYHDPQQLIAKAGASLNVSGEITGVDIANGSDESGPHEGELHLARGATTAILNATASHLLPLEI